jgi:hypothetical protein
VAVSAASHHRRRAVGVAAAGEGLVADGVAADRGSVAPCGSHSDQSVAPTPSLPMSLCGGHLCGTHALPAVGVRQPGGAAHPLLPLQPPPPRRLPPTARRALPWSAVKLDARAAACFVSACLAPTSSSPKMVDPDLLYLSHPFFFFIRPWERPPWLLPDSRSRSRGRPGRHPPLLAPRPEQSRLQPVARPGSRPLGMGSSPGAWRNRCSNRISVSAAVDLRVPFRQRQQVRDVATQVQLCMILALLLS